MDIRVQGLMRLIIKVMSNSLRNIYSLGVANRSSLVGSAGWGGAGNSLDGCDAMGRGFDLPRSG